MSNANSIKVAIKVRPLIKREKEQKLGKHWQIKGDTIECTSALNPNCKFSFDQICDETIPTQELFEKVALPIVESSIKGFNGTIFAYGQTSSGKTHTMLGDDAEPGITVLSIRQIFDYINNDSMRSYLLRVSYIEIYNEKVYDLLDKRNELKVHESASGDTVVNSIENVVKNEDLILDAIKLGNKERRVAETNMNVQSSRSHTIFSIIIESTDKDAIDGAVQLSVLNLVDLAGSERANATGATGSRLKEGAHINKSLLSLSLVINKLSEDPDQHINYRDSKLTRILQPSLGGNSLTAIICTITPAAIEETNFTLGFANRAKRIKNRPVVNEVMSDAAMIKRMCKQINELEQNLLIEREKCKKIERDLFIHRGNIITAKKKPIENRRRTWAPTTSADATVIDIAKPTLENLPEDTSFSNEKFISLDDMSFSNIPPVPNELKMTRNRSLLRTPKSIFKTMENRLSTSSVLTPVHQAEPNRRIKYLEKELQEMEEFKKIEDEHYKAEVAALQSKAEHLKKSFEEREDQLRHELNEKSVEIDNLKSKMEKSLDDRKQFQAKMKQLEAETAVYKKEKEIAESNYAGIDYEYKQYKIRSKEREQELIEQADDNKSNDLVAQLKAKIKEMTEAQHSVEARFWDAEKNMELEHKKQLQEYSQLTEEHKMLIEKFDRNQIELTQLRNEYDELSTQMMDQIQENENLASASKGSAQLQETIAELKTKLMEVEESYEAEQKALLTVKIQMRETDKSRTHLLNEYKRMRQMFDVVCITLNHNLNKPETQLNGNKTKANDDEDCFIASADENRPISPEEEKESSYCERLLRDNIDFDNICNINRITAGFALNELEILRHAFSDLKIFIAQQEIDNLKLHKTICDEELIDRTMNATAVVGSNQMEEMEMKIDELSEKCADYESKLREINSNLCNLVSDEKFESSAERINCIREKMNQREKILKILSENQMILSCEENIENELIESLKQSKQTQGKLDEIQLQITELQAINQKSNEQLEEVRQDKEELRSLIEEKLHEIQKISDEKKTTEDLLETMLMGKDSEFDEERARLNDEILRQNEELQQLRQAIDDKEATDQKSDEIQLLQKKIESIEVDKAKIETQLKEMVDAESNEIKSLTDRISSIEEEKSKLENEWKTERQEKSKQLNELHAEVQCLREQMVTETEKLKEIEAQKSTIELQLNAKTQLIAKMEAEKRILNECQQSMGDVNEKLRQTLEEKSQLNGEKIKTDNENVQLKKSILDLNEKITASNQSIDEFIRQIQELSKKLESTEQLLATKQQELSKSNEDVSIARDKNNQLLDENNNLKVKLDETKENATAECAKKIAKYEKVSNDLAEEIAKIRNELEKSKESEEKLRTQITGLQQKILVADDEQEVLEREISRINGEIKAKNTEIEKLKSENAKFTQELTQRAHEMADKTNEIQKLQKSLIEMGERIENLQTEKNRIESGCKNLTESNEQQKALINRLNQQINESSSVVMELTRKDAEIKLLTERLANSEVSKSDQTKSRRSNESGKRLSGSGQTNVDVENLIRENKELKIKHDRLTDELNRRRSKRQSVHDDTRRISGFEWTHHDIETQTDPVNEMCRCLELNERIKELKRDIVIKDAKYKTLQLHSGVDALKRENSELKTSLANAKTALDHEQMQHQRTLDKLEASMDQRRRARNVGVQVSIGDTKSNAQTNTNGDNENAQDTGFVAQMDFYKVTEKYQMAKKKIMQLQEQYGQLQAAANEAEASLVIHKEKYNKAKILCLHRQSEIERLQNEVEQISNKYDKLKQLANHRKTEIDRLQRECEIARNNLLMMEGKYNQMKMFYDENGKKTGSGVDENQPMNNHRSIR